MLTIDFIGQRFCDTIDLLIQPNTIDLRYDFMSLYVLQCTIISKNSVDIERSQASPSMRLASDRDNAQKLRSIEVRINKNGNQHEETCYKLGNIVFFG